jgi:hypothetical protein
MDFLCGWLRMPTSLSGIGFLLVNIPRAVATVVWGDGAVQVKGDQSVEASVRKRRSKYKLAAQVSHLRA